MGNAAKRHKRLLKLSHIKLSPTDQSFMIRMNLKLLEHEIITTIAPETLIVQRHCTNCKARLNSYNKTKECSSCLRKRLQGL